MRRKLNTREKVLLIGLAVGAVVLIRGWREESAGLGRSRPEPRQVRELGEPPVVRMDMLAGLIEGFESGRDLFAYYVPPRPRPVVKPQPAVRQTPKVRNPPPPPPPAPPPPPSKPRMPQPRFKYLGFLGPKDARIAVFEGSEDLILAREGDVVALQFKLLEFKYEKVLLGYTEDPWKDSTTELRMTAGSR